MGDEPTPEPTPEPSPSPTKSPTHICPLKQEMNCCCPDCDYSSVDHVAKEIMMNTCEMNHCQFDSVGGNCVSGPDWHHCTAKCAITASPTAEPTDDPTPEPTPSPSIGECPENGMDSNGDSCNGFEAVCKYDFVECCGHRGPNTICQCEHGTFQCIQSDRCMKPCPTPEPTVDNGGGWGNPKTPQPTKPQRTPRPIVVRTPRPIKEKTPRPIKERTPRPIVVRTPRPTANKVKTPRPIKEKTPRPIKEKTPRPTKEPKTKRPRPTKKPKKTPRPTAVYITPEPTVGNGWGEQAPSKDILKNERVEMIAVDVNGSTETYSGYSSQTEIVGLLSVATVFAICGYSMMCKKRKGDQYEAIEDSNSTNI